MDIDDKIRELALKYDIPESLLQEARNIETGKVTAKNRRLAPKIVELIAKYTDTSS